MQHWMFALSTTGPIILMLCLGWFLRRREVLNENFIKQGNSLVFNISLPSLLFLSTASNPLSHSLDFSLVILGVLFTLASVLLLFVVSRPWLRGGRQGVFIQGAFRGNMGIIGIAMVLNAYGMDVLPKAALFLAFMTMTFNVVSVALLGAKRSRIISSLLKNPLIIAILAGLLCSALGLQLPDVVAKTCQYLANMTLPLALICIGASLQWQSFKSNLSPVLWASACKLIIIPLLAVTLALYMQFSGSDIGLLFLMMGTPTAAASYVMASKMTEHGQVAGEIVAFTTMFSALSVSVGLVTLASLQLI
ncbi:AEC family transporter [Agarivorans sp. QJM3NY_29]|uniref:AEC family transporter n=1 Tax=unclassified Agarivorans TaxID=2636026 RepID=UPI003D7D6ADE